MRLPNTAEHLTDDDGGKADDDCAATHVDVRKALILSHERAGEGDNAVRKSKTQYFYGADIDAESRAHGGVAAGGTQGAALFRAEEPVVQGNEQQADDGGKHDGARNIAGGEQKREFIHADCLVCRHSHDAQID